MLTAERSFVCPLVHDKLFFIWQFAAFCDETTCLLPKCRCISASIPANLPASNVPQIVMVTFDDYINSENYNYYAQLYPQSDPITNPNGCTARATFFVSGLAETNFIVSCFCPLFFFFLYFMRLLKWHVYWIPISSICQMWKMCKMCKMEKVE